MIDPAELPIARELFAQWRKARGDRAEPATRPFSRSWEQLMEDAGLLAATDRSEADRDIRDLHVAGWLEARPVRYRPHTGLRGRRHTRASLRCSDALRSMEGSFVPS